MSDLDAIREDVALAARSAEMARHVALDHAPELLDRSNGPAHPVVHDDSSEFMTEIGPTQHRAVVRWGVPEAVAS